MSRRTLDIEVGASLIATALLLGCSAAEDERLDRSENPRAVGTQVALLPPPTISRVDLLKYDSEQQRRYEEKEWYLAEQYHAQGWRIVETTQTYIGDIVDWLDPASVPGSQIEPPPKPSPEELQPTPGALLGLTEFDLYPELRGLQGTVPVLRPSFMRYVLEETGASSIQDFIQQNQAQGMPAGRNRLYAGLGKTTSNTAAYSLVTPFAGTIESGTMTLLEVAVVNSGPNPSTTHEQVGIAISRDKINFGYVDSDLRIQVEFMARGDSTGNDKGGWHGVVTGFIAIAGSPYPVGSIVIPSTIGGLQYQYQLGIQLSGGNWWISLNGNWLGYYPGRLFDLINASAAQAFWYGEVYDPTPTNWTWTDMGSGVFASYGGGNASSFINPSYTIPSGSTFWADGAVDVGPSATACYTKSPLYSSSWPGYRFFFLGGPGGEAPGCD